MRKSKPSSFPEAISAAEEEYGEKIEDSMFVAELVSDNDAVSLLESYFPDWPKNTIIISSEQLIASCSEFFLYALNAENAVLKNM